MIRSLNFYRGIVCGAMLMYLLDPAKGRARRALLRDKLAGALHDTEDFLGKATGDLRNRAESAMARSDSRVGPGRSDDETIVERVRTKLGRYVAHPHAVRVEASDGVVTLHGPVLRGEAEELVGAVSSVRGVKEVMNRLEPHDSSEGIPSLRGGRRIGRGVRISPGLQLVAGVLGATAVALGAGRIAARVRASRHDTLEREMPEYAMLR